MRYMYFPFKSFSDDDAVKDSRKRFKEYYGKSGIIERSHGWINKARKPLKVVQASDTLEIVAHGNKDTPDIIAGGRKSWGKTWYKDRTHNDLAQQLMDEGLAKSHRKIKLIVCEAAGPGVFDAAARKYVYDDSKDYFAQLLAKSLGKLGYSSIVVGGFAGDLSDGYDDGWVPRMLTSKLINNEAGEYTPDEDGLFEYCARGQAKWFNTTGTETAKPF